MTIEDELRQEIEDLQAENARLRQANFRVQLLYKEFHDMLFGPDYNRAPNYLDIALELKAIKPFSQVLAELGISRFTEE